MDRPPPTGPTTAPPPDRPAGDAAFLCHTRVEAAGAGRYRGRIDRSWWIISGPNGGYVAAIVLRAVVAEVVARGADPARRRPRSATFHFLRPPSEGPVEVEVTVEREGRSVTEVSARMTQEGRTLVLALVAVAEDRVAPVSFDEDPGLPALAGGVGVPAPEDVPAEDPDPERDVPMRAHYDLRWVVGDRPFHPSPAGASARCGGWMRLADPCPVDEVVLVAMSDAWLPPVFSRVDQPLAVPTVDLTVHFRARPGEASGWCFVEFTSPVAAEGYLVEHGRLLDRHGRLLAESRQLAVVT